MRKIGVLAVERMMLSLEQIFRLKFIYPFGGRANKRPALIP